MADSSSSGMGTFGIFGTGTSAIAGGGTGTPPISAVASAAASSASPVSAGGAPMSWGGGAGAYLSKNRSSSTGTGMTRVLFFSAATSTTVCSSLSCNAAGSRAITLAAMASRLEAWYSPSAEMILARRSRSASACRDMERFICSGRFTSLSSTRSTRMPHGPCGAAPG